MEEPSPEEMYRVATALQPFVLAYDLPVNLENLELMAYAVARYLHSPESDAEVTAAVEGLIEQERADHAAMGAAMERSIAAGQTRTVGEAEAPPTSGTDSSRPTSP